jgi:hypothetical protein
MAERAACVRETTSAHKILLRSTEEKKQIRRRSRR